MDFDAAFPLKLYLNLTKHDDRRRAVENELLDAGIEDYERLAAYAGKWAGSWRGYPSADRYAQALSHKRAVWTGWRRRAAAVLVFEDDVVTARNLKESFGELELPDDWAIFYFGCEHRERPTVVAPGVVRCALAWGMHAYAVRASAYREVARALTPFGKGAPGLPPTGLHSCDEQMAGLCERLPVYAAWPNLAWRRGSTQEALEDGSNDSYTPEGRQTSFPEAVAGLDDEMRERFDADRASRTTIKSSGGSGPDRLLFCRTAEDVGFGERLRGLASLRFLARLNGQTACVWWPEGMASLPAMHDDLLEPTGYRCVSDEQEWRRLSQGVASVERASCALSPEAAIDLARRRGLGDGRSEEDLLDLWRRLARDVRPSRVVESRVAAALESWQARRPLGLHICRRRQDPTPSPTDIRRIGHYQELTPQGCDAVFLACDDVADERECRGWLEGRGIRVLGSNRVWRAGRVRERSIEDEAVDLFLLSRCDRVVASEWSVTSWMASVIGGVPYVTDSTWMEK